MPTNRELEIIMRLKDEVTNRLQGVGGSIAKFAADCHKVGRNMRQVGHEIEQVGTNFMIMGAAITGPLALAFKSAE